MALLPVSPAHIQDTGLNSISLWGLAVFSRKERLERRRKLARLLIKRGIPPAQAHSDVGYLFNRAPILSVEGAILASLDEPDPICSAMELLARAAA